jgi:hypothetical protein
MAQTEPVYSEDISKIHNCLDIVLKDTKDNLDGNKAKIHKEMRATISDLIKNKVRINGAIRRINAEEMADDIISIILKDLPLSKEMITNLHDALVPILKADWRGAKK